MKLPMIILASFVASNISSAQDKALTPLSAMVETERAFAKTCGEKGIRASFLQFFADDCITFFPQPVKYKEAVRDRPAPDPKAVTLQWEPQAGDVAASGDLGYTAGPFIRTDNTKENEPKHYGQFFSLWKKQQDGTWRVVVDIGTSTPTPVSPLGSPFRASEARTHTQWKKSADHQHEIINVEQEFSVLCAAKGIQSGYVSRAGKGIRLHRENTQPIVGLSALRSHLDTLNVAASWSPVAGEISGAGDLGYAYGRYDFKSKDGRPARDEHGFYLHVWRRGESGSWKLVADITNPEPDEGAK